MNTIIKNNKEYNLIGYWDDDGFDSKGNKFIKPINIKTEWHNKFTFIMQLDFVQLLLKETDYYKKYDENKDCLICSEKNITKGRYIWKKNIWEDGLTHYIEKHNFQPSDMFLDLIFFFKLEHKLKINSTIKTTQDKKYIKINQNQLHILDALMEHGGYTKKYLDTTNQKIMRYSEHTGLLDFNTNILEKIVVAGNTTRVDKGDDEIFLPTSLPDILDYEYIFHTHPPTPKPGGRVGGGVLYEFPSMGDLLHFIDHFNDGKICGSLIVTSEGLYNIRKIKLDREKIKIDEDKLFKKFNENFYKIQSKYIDLYTTNFTKKEFYEKISQNKKPIEELNNVINEFGIHVEYYPRIKIKSNWILDKVYLPIF
jgi:hypothetical protein